MNSASEAAPPFSSCTHRPLAKRCLVALAAVVIATLFRIVLDHWFEDRILFVSYFTAIAFAAWYGGVGVGAATAVASYLVTDYLFMPPRYAFTLLEWNRSTFNSATAFTAISATILILTDVLSRAVDTSKREAQRAEEQRNLLEVTLSSIGDAVIATDAEQRITFMNGVAERLTGWHYAEAAGRPLDQVFRIVSEHTDAPAESPIAAVLRSGLVMGLANHTVLISKDGQRWPIDDSAAPILDDATKILGVVMVFRDVTGQRRAHQAAQSLAAIVEYSDDAMISKTMSGQITSWNAAAERLYGYSAAEAIGQPISIIVPPDHKSELIDIMRRLKAGERIDAWDTVRVRKDGSRVAVSLRISPIKSSEGEVIGASKVARDISRQKRDEESLVFLADASRALAALRDRVSTLECLARVCVPYFADWCIVYAYDDVGKIVPIAYTHRTIAGQRILAEFLERWPFSLAAPTATARVFRSGEPQLVEEMSPELLAQLNSDPQLSAPTQNLNPRSVISAPLRVRGVTAGAITFVLSDAGRKYDFHDLQLAIELAGRAATAIENAQLLYTVQESVRQKDDFLAMLSHELRNPLAAIGYATALGRLPGADPKHDVFPVIERQVSHLTHLIDDLLDVARITRDKITLKLSAVDLTSIVRHASEAARPQLEEKGHVFSIEIEPTPMPVNIDVTRAEQVIVNLLTNAAKYTPDGGRVTLSAGPENGYAVVRVVDTGIGLATEMLSKVFDLFSQADRTLDRSEGGLGIGLTIVRRLVEMHGGSVAAYSRGAGQGSEFVVRWPLRDDASSAEPQQPTAVVAEISDSQHVVSVSRILVVDDNLDTAQLSALLLRNSGFTVEIAHDGEEAIERADATAPDALLLDIGLPRLNGYEVARRLRDSGYAGKLVAVSGYGQAEDRRRSQEAGFDHHFVKPVDHRELLAVLRTPRTAV